MGPSGAYEAALEVLRKIALACPACDSRSTWCVWVDEESGRDDRYCDSCKHQWQTYHPSPSAPKGTS